MDTIFKFERDQMQLTIETEFVFPARVRQFVTACCTPFGFGDTPQNQKLVSGRLRTAETFSQRLNSGWDGQKI